MPGKLIGPSFNLRMFTFSSEPGRTRIRVAAKFAGSLGFLISLSGCSEESDFLGGNIHGYNHTSSSVNYFFINGFGGGHASPFSKSGAVCCISLPRKWRPGMLAEVQWEADPNPFKPAPKMGTHEFQDFMIEHEKNYSRHVALVEVPRYEDVCGIEVHFLTCNEVKLSTSCWGYSSPKNLIKEPMQMKEPSVCVKK